LTVEARHDGGSEQLAAASDTASRHDVRLEIDLTFHAPETWLATEW
jgi:hypothetical protein